MKKLEQAVEKIKTLQANCLNQHGEWGIMAVQTCKDILALLQSLKQDLACPECKGLPKPIYGNRMEKFENGKLVPNCPTCDGKGDYRSWAEELIGEYRMRALGRAGEVADLRNQLAEKDKQIAGYCERIHNLEDENGKYFEQLAEKNRQIEELKECQKWQGVAEHRQTVIDSKNCVIEKLTASLADSDKENDELLAKVNELTALIEKEKATK